MSTKKSKLSTKGLEKIFGDNMDSLIDEIEGNSEKYIKEYANKLDIDTIELNPYQPRRIFNKDKLNELAQSIIENGVIQPILVKPSINGKYYLIAGERRLRASKLANLKQIPVIILDVTDEKMHEYALIENIQRVDLNPIEEAISFFKLIQLFKINQEQLSIKIGKSSSYISNSIRLLNLPDSVQKLILENKLTMGHVKPLLAIANDKKIVEKIAEKIIAENWNVRKVEQYISNFRDGNINHDNKNNKVNPNNEINVFLEKRIIEKLGTKVTINNQKIIISYVGVNDLNRILNILNLGEQE